MDKLDRKGGVALVLEHASDWAYVVHDGTLKGARDNGEGGEYGFEIVTYPFTPEWLKTNRDRIADFLLLMKQQGCRSWTGGRCGMHIHLSRAPMTEDHQMRFLQFFYGSTNLATTVGQRGYDDKGLQRFSPFDREDRSKFIYKIRNFINPPSFLNAGDLKHYAAINANKKHTYEARFFRGTIKPQAVWKNVEFMLSVWEFTRVTDNPRSANEVNYASWLRAEPQCHEYPHLLTFLNRAYFARSIER